MAIDRKVRANTQIDFAAIGYPAAREAFNDTLALCVAKLSKSEIRLAEDRLDAGLLEGLPGLEEMLKDTALYSRNDKRIAKRAIDRVTAKLLRVHDPLKSAIAARLPAAVFSIFRVEETPEEGMILGHDMLDAGRVITIMDNALAALVGNRGETLIAGRFVDLGPWHIGFGIVRPLRKSEAVAVGLTFSGEDNPVTRRDDLHELIYGAELHDENLVMTALEPLIAALAMAIDEDIIDPDDIVAGFASLVSDEGDDAHEPEQLAVK